MKKKEKYLMYCLLLFLNTSPVSNKTYGQDWEGENTNKLSNEWVFNINFGFLSYFGDLSIYDSNILGKLENESGQAGGIIVTKRIIKPFGLSVQLLTGKLKASKGNISFESINFEYSLSAYLDLISLVKMNKLKNLEVQIFGGVGNLIFSSTKFEYYEGKTVRTDHKTRVPEFVYFTGAGVHYNFTDNFGIMSSISLRRCQNDKLDAYHRPPDFDYYSYLQFGVTYSFVPVAKVYINNRARVAHSDERLDALK